MFAAFGEDGSVRGVGTQIAPSFGPFDGETLYEISLYSNAGGDILSFKYYDASEDVVLGGVFIALSQTLKSASSSAMTLNLILA